jgi:hypothetical protein
MKNKQIERYSQSNLNVKNFDQAILHLGIKSKEKNIHATLQKIDFQKLKSCY